MPSSILKKQEITDFGQQLHILDSSYIFWTTATYVRYVVKIGVTQAILNLPENTSSLIADFNSSVVAFLSLRIVL